MDLKALAASLVAAAAKMSLPTEAPKPKLSQTQLKRRIRAWKTRPRASCDSFRYRQKHQGATR
jgi:hypothetical protein